MEGYIDKNRWIDLSSLPRKTYGNKTRIDWKNSVRCILPFKYEKVEGNLTICDYEMTKAGNTYLYVYIENYIPTAIRIQTGVLSHFELHKFLKHKIVDYASWMQQYLADPMDAYKYCYSSNKYINTKCPVCGHIDKMIVSNMYYRGFRCAICDSNISFPNRLMRSILTQLSIDFIPEVGSRHGFDWMGKYLYDFWIQDTNGKNILIEMDGGFHRYEEQKKIDIIKTKLAITNGFDVVRIDCMYQDYDKFEYIKNKIINSALSGVLPLKKIDWDVCLSDAQKNIFLQVCKMYDSGDSIEDISIEMKLSRTTIHKYIKQGYSIGVCRTYTESGYAQRRDFKRVAQIRDGAIVRVFASRHEVESLSDDIYGVHLTKWQVGCLCRNEESHPSGLNFKYITREEYKQYKIINNEVVLKEAI